MGQATTLGQDPSTYSALDLNFLLSTCPVPLPYGACLILPGAQTEVRNMCSMAIQPFLKLWAKGESDGDQPRWLHVAPRPSV